jgi:hypothetical protein
VSDIPQLEPGALSEILAKHAKDLSDAEVTTLISVLRAERASYLAAEVAGTKRTKSVITKAAEQVDLKTLSFDDLGLG